MVQQAAQDGRDIAAIKQELCSKAESVGLQGAGDALDAALCVDGMGSLLISYAQQQVCLFSVVIHELVHSAACLSS